ncbi:hypothetical protein M422DRAFT_276296 [Sphaerobolus stellatus SS14]|uniref:Uncharacterized protein n=1 Tax=Sphaerobolus stellatus (strain SS14) TaxID=990650 RepID=A0A0C9TMU9_SPHS4|nr:hypothetical protein M422DRAFT_276296 [Sphaerobolus stellatus SS14]
MRGNDASALRSAGNITSKVSDEHIKISATLNPWNRSFEGTWAIVDANIGLRQELRLTSKDKPKLPFRYHQLCAALQKKFNLLGYDISNLSLRKRIDFPDYTDFALGPIDHVKLHPREDGTMHLGDIEVYVDGFESNWKVQEGRKCLILDWRISRVLELYAKFPFIGKNLWNQRIGWAIQTPY